MKVRKKELSEKTIWRAMKNRCYNDKNKSFKYWGGRGIIVCDKWKNSFADFYQDMGARPSANHSIDRINNDGNYEPENCRWATKKEQWENRNYSFENENMVKLILDTETGIFYYGHREAAISKGMKGNTLQNQMTGRKGINRTGLIYA